MSGQIPEGYLKNQQGHLVPINSIDQHDLDRDELIQELVSGAKVLQTAMAKFKAQAMGDIEAFIDLAAERYEVKLGGRKGNVSLTSFDGRYKIQIAVSDRLVFDERIQAAKALVDECILIWTEGSSSEIKALVEHAFQTDKEGKINLGRILSLMRLSIDDPKWRRAMDAIKDSMQVASSSTYLRIYERQEDGKKYQQIVLDIAGL